MGTLTHVEKRPASGAGETAGAAQPGVNPERETQAVPEPEPKTAVKQETEAAKKTSANPAAPAATPATGQAAEPATETEETVLKVKGLNLWYGDVQALYNIHMDIPKNRVTAIIGPSGCGKSSFIKTLNRMAELNPLVRTEGEILFDGRNVFDQSWNVEELRTRIGMVFQKPNPFPKSIYDNVAYGPRIHGIRKKALLDDIVERSLRAAALWDEVKDRLKENAYGLSGGQQQRLCIARTLAVEPEVILMDEPTSALDPISILKIEAMIAELKKDCTIVIVTHNMQQAARISDRTAFFLNGRIEEYGDTIRLFATPASPKTEDYIKGRFG